MLKVVLLAGGYGSRLAELTEMIPKPMVPIGPYPILWHIMKLYAHHGAREFVIACGYKGEVIKEYFHNFHIKHTDATVRLRTGEREVMRRSAPDWEVTLVDTGLDTMTGGRVRRLAEVVGEETFMLTYGDGVSDLDISALLAFHRAHGKAATVTAVRPPARFGGLAIGEGGQVERFSEKPQTEGGWINGGFFVFEPRVLEYMGGDDSILEREPLERLASDGELVAFRHEGFWQPMDTLREKRALEAMWREGSAPWKVW